MNLSGRTIRLRVLKTSRTALSNIIYDYDIIRYVSKSNIIYAFGVLEKY